MRTTLVPSFAARPETLGLAAELGDCVRDLIDGLFDTYRPELHYMRGPGLKWRAKHDAQNGGAVCIDSRCPGAIAAPARGTIKSQNQACWAAPCVIMACVCREPHPVWRRSNSAILVMEAAENG